MKQSVKRGSWVVLPHFEYLSKFLWPFWKARETLQSATSKALLEGGEMAQQRWLLVVLSEDPSSVPSSHTRQLTPDSALVPRNVSSLQPLRLHAQTHTYH